MQALFWMFSSDFRVAAFTETRVCSRMLPISPRSGERGCTEYHSQAKWLAREIPVTNKAGWFSITQEHIVLQPEFACHALSPRSAPARF
jgi:hypothetical protein